MQVKGFRFSLAELGGALGDLGTMVPLLIGLVVVNGLDARLALAGVGLLYIASGLYFRLPMPVQPLKAVAAIAISLGLSGGLVVAAGWLLGVILLFLALTRLITPLARLFTRPVVRGIQLGIGLLLVKKAADWVSDGHLFPGDGQPFFSLAGVSLPWGLFLGGGGIALLALLLRSRRFPASLALLGLGVGVGLAMGMWGQVPQGSAPLPRWGASDLGRAFFLLVIPQLPLTLGNSVIATAHAARAYFGDGAKKVTHRSLLASLGLANIGLGMTGGMPLCHGAGGLTAHYHFGARTGGANLMVGGLFLILALGLGGSSLAALSLLPYPVLGVLLLYVGLQHSLLARDLRGWWEVGLAAGMAVITLTTSNLAYAFLFAIALEGLRRLLPALRPSLETARD